jgi:hypothetical protein
MALRVNCVTGYLRMQQPAVQELAGGTPKAARKCARCGLVNFAEADNCRRCHSDLFAASSAGAETMPPAPRSRGIASRVAFIAGAIVLSVFAWSRSLLLTSTPIDEMQRQTVLRAVAALERAGFTREVVMLRHFANYRATDNWWNTYLGHSQAYAATNFPLGVVTLYEPFFAATADDTERAAILLHEAQHLLGAGEAAALETTWRAKARIGWTADQYGHTRVWRNTREWTAADVPALFQCGAHVDCVP